MGICYIIRYSLLSHTARRGNQMKPSQKAIPASGNNNESKWVALSHDEKTVVTTGSSFINVYNRAVKKGEGDPVMLKVLPKSMCLIL